MMSKQIASATRAAVRGYRKTIAATTELSPLDVHYFRVDVESLLEGADEKAQTRGRKVVDRATRKDIVRALQKLTKLVDGEHGIVANPPLIVRTDELLEGEERERVAEFFRSYKATLAPHRSAVPESRTRTSIPPIVRDQARLRVSNLGLDLR